MTEKTDRFRRVMSRFATGVTIVTGIDPGRGPVGLTANAVASVSLEPCLLLVCMDGRSSSLAVVLQTGRFGLSILRDGDDGIARRFSSEHRDERFKGLGLRSIGSGMLVLSDCLAWLDCRVWGEHEAGDHRIVVGEVVECGAGEERDPLVFFRGEYGTVAT